MRLFQARLLVHDFPRAFRFWRDVVGLPLSWGDENGSYADFDTATGRVAIFKSDEMAAALGEKSDAARGADQVVLVFTVDDVDAWYGRLQERGVRFVSPPIDRSTWGIRAAHFRDPEGALIEIYQDLPTTR